MQTSNRFFDDLAKVANSAVSTLAGVKGEIEAMVNQRLERFLTDMDVVPRDEFEAIKAVAVKARAEQEKLEKRMARLEARLAAKPTAKPAIKTRAKPASKAAAKPRKRARKSTGA
jgi:BMFP domain-containing protein YqiC